MNSEADPFGQAAAGAAPDAGRHVERADRVVAGTGTECASGAEPVLTEINRRPG